MPPATRLPTDTPDGTTGAAAKPPDGITHVIDKSMGEKCCHQTMLLPDGTTDQMQFSTKSHSKHSPDITILEDEILQVVPATFTENEDALKSKDKKIFHTKNFSQKYDTESVASLLSDESNTEVVDHESTHQLQSDLSSHSDDDVTVVYPNVKLNRSRSRDSHFSVGSFSLWSTTRRQKLILVSLAMVDFFSNLCLSVLAPFFPTEVSNWSIFGKQNTLFSRGTL